MKQIQKVRATLVCDLNENTKVNVCKRVIIEIVTLTVEHRGEEHMGRVGRKVEISSWKM